jgi:hypothetical protein
MVRYLRVGFRIALVSALIVLILLLILLRRYEVAATILTTVTPLLTCSR